MKIIFGEDQFEYAVHQLGLNKDTAENCPTLLEDYHNVFHEFNINNIARTEENFDTLTRSLFQMYINHKCEAGDDYPKIDETTLVNYLTILSAFRHELNYSKKLIQLGFAQPPVTVHYEENGSIPDKKKGFLGDSENRNINRFWIEAPVSPQATVLSATQDIYVSSLGMSALYFTAFHTAETDGLTHALGPLSSQNLAMTFYKPHLIKRPHPPSVYRLTGRGEMLLSAVEECIPIDRQETKDIVRSCAETADFNNVGIFWLPSLCVMEELGTKLDKSKTCFSEEDDFSARLCIYFDRISAAQVEQHLVEDHCRAVNIPLSAALIVKKIHGMPATNFETLLHDIYFHTWIEAYYLTHLEPRLHLAKLIRCFSDDPKMLTSFIWQHCIDCEGLIRAKNYSQYLVKVCARQSCQQEGPLFEFILAGVFSTYLALNANKIEKDNYPSILIDAVKQYLNELHLSQEMQLISCKLLEKKTGHQPKVDLMCELDESSHTIVLKKERKSKSVEVLVEINGHQLTLEQYIQEKKQLKQQKSFDSRTSVASSSCTLFPPLTLNLLAENEIFTQKAALVNLSYTTFYAQHEMLAKKVCEVARRLLFLFSEEDVIAYWEKNPSHRSWLLDQTDSIIESKNNMQQLQ